MSNLIYTINNSLDISFAIHLLVYSIKRNMKIKYILLKFLAIKLNKKYEIAHILVLIMTFLTYITIY